VWFDSKDKGKELVHTLRWVHHQIPDHNPVAPASSAPPQYLVHFLHIIQYNIILTTHFGFISGASLGRGIMSRGTQNKFRV
jgi:hypothetical protein